MKKHGVIYYIKNTINGKSYIGQTTENNPNRRIKRHFNCKNSGCKYLQRSIKKYGKKNFKVSIIYTSFDQEDLNKQEKYFIKLFKTLSPNGYNLKKGGEQGGKLTQITKDKIGKKIKLWYSKNPHPFKGKKFTKKHIENLSKVRKGFTSEARRKAHKETCKKLSIPIQAIEIKTNKIYTFESIAQCAKVLDLCSANISRVLNGKQNRTQHKGYKFKKNLDKEKEVC